jgi:hypothetical protein
MGDDPAAWRCRRSQGPSDGRRCHTVVEIRLTSRTIGSLRLGPRSVGRIATAGQASKTGKQGERGFYGCQARSGDPYCRRARDPALGYRRAARRLLAWPRGSPPPDGDARHFVHAPCDTARPLRHDRSLRQTRQPGRQRWCRSRPGIAGPTRERDPDARHDPLPPVRHTGLDRDLAAPPTRPDPALQAPGHGGQGHREAKQQGWWAARPGCHPATDRPSGCGVGGPRHVRAR